MHVTSRFCASETCFTSNIDIRTRIHRIHNVASVWPARKHKQTMQIPYRAGNEPKMSQSQSKMPPGIPTPYPTARRQTQRQRKGNVASPLRSHRQRRRRQKTAQVPVQLQRNLPKENANPLNRSELRPPHGRRHSRASPGHTAP